MVVGKGKEVERREAKEEEEGPGEEMRFGRVASWRNETVPTAAFTDLCLNPQRSSFQLLALVDLVYRIGGECSKKER